MHALHWTTQSHSYVHRAHELYLTVCTQTSRTCTVLVIRYTDVRYKNFLDMVTLYQKHHFGTMSQYPGNSLHRRHVIIFLKNKSVFAETSCTCVILITVDMYTYIMHNMILDNLYTNIKYMHGIRQSFHKRKIHLTKWLFYAPLLYTFMCGNLYTDVLNCTSL